MLSLINNDDTSLLIKNNTLTDTKRLCIKMLEDLTSLLLNYSKTSFTNFNLKNSNRDSQAMILHSSNQMQ